MRLGDIIGQMAELRKVKLTELAHGICSGTELSRFVYDETKEMDLLTFYAIIGRLHIALDRFSVMASQTELAYFRWKEEMEEAIRLRDFEKLQSRRTPPVDRYMRSSLLRQYDHYLNYIVQTECVGDPQKAYAEIRDAIAYMVEDHPSVKLSPGRYSATEFGYYLNFLIAARRANVATDTECAEALRQTLQVIYQDEFKDEHVIIVPKTVATMIVYFGDQFRRDEIRIWLRIAIQLLVHNAMGYELPTILELCCKYDLQNEEGSDDLYERSYRAICLAYQIGGEETTFNLYDLHQWSHKTLSIGKYLQDKRIENQITQEEISDEVIGVRRYSSIENGKAKPHRKTYVALAEKVDGWKNYYNARIITDELSVFILLTEARQAVNRGEKEALREALYQLRKRLDGTIPENNQFLQELGADLDFFEGHIRLTERIERFETALRVTFDSSKEPTKLVYSVEESDLIYKIVRAKRICGTLGQEDIDRLQSVIRCEEKASSAPWYKLCGYWRLMAGIFEDQNKYEECTNESYELIAKMIQYKCNHVLPDCLNLIAECSPEKSNPYNRELIQAAYDLCDLYQFKGNKQYLGESLLAWDKAFLSNGN